MNGGIIFFDTEVGKKSGRVWDYGAVREDGVVMHESSETAFRAFIRGARWLAGHNILDFDLTHIAPMIQEECPEAELIDTLYLSALLFPARPYHFLVKDDKLQSGELNNPLKDAEKAAELFRDEREAFAQLPAEMKKIDVRLLAGTRPFGGFFRWLRENGETETADLIRLWEDRRKTDFETEQTADLIRYTFQNKFCRNVNLNRIIAETPTELAYALALIRVDDRYSITPPWVIRRMPGFERVMQELRETPCSRPDCLYCARKMDVRSRLKEIFGFDSFRTYEGVPLQEQAAEAAVQGRSLLAVFPTGGGKSLTFQLPALMAGEVSRGLTVVISPLQSLMKDQVDHLEQRGIADAVTINGMLDPVERKAAIERIENGMASLLYISPESLRSRSIEHMLMNRRVVRFVIDEAHCFSAWGQDFRVDYLYIGPFIRKLGEAKQMKSPIPVSCFTATAKQKVISDIQDYFRRELGVELSLFATRAARENLHYSVLFRETEDEKYAEVRRLIRQKDCPTIIYASRVRKTKQLAERLRGDGINAEPYNGRMDSAEKVRIQNAFLQDEIRVIVATSAFGMGVDKKDVGLVIHYDISDSLENYTQEAGRAGRDPSLEADCYVLFNDGDLDKHFILLNQTRLSFSEIQQVWRGIKDLTRGRKEASCSPLELARMAGWDDSVTDPETRVTGAVAALESAGYLERGKNMPHIYANSIQASNVIEAARRMAEAGDMTEKEQETARRVLSYLISRKNTRRGLNEEAESRVDYLADRLGLPKETVIYAIQQMRDEGLLADQMDLTVFLRVGDSQNKSEQILNEFLKLEEYLIDHLPEGDPFNYRELNDSALKSGINGATVRRIKTLVFFCTLTGDLKKSFQPDDDQVRLERKRERADQMEQYQRRAELSRFIVRYLYQKSSPADRENKEMLQVSFSVTELVTTFPERKGFDAWQPGHGEVEQALLFLSKIQALTIDGGFLVSYNAMQVKRLETDNRVQYKKNDYRQLEAFYQQRMQQIHIVGEYAHLMVRDYDEALQFVRDYFQMEYEPFLKRYFKGEREEEIRRNITPQRYDKLFAALSPAQRAIIDDHRSATMVVLAGPGSGKTRVLVHKLAALLTMEDVKHDQMLMLTFSRSAATEFKQRLLALVDNAAHLVEIRTFHSYCFDLMGKIGNLNETEHVVSDAVRMIEEGRAEPRRITKTVLVIDEAQDMDASEYALVTALRKVNPGMRVIAVGDDDQNIFAFRGSDSRYMAALARAEGAQTRELLENYRSDRAIVALANAFAQTLCQRLKTHPVHSAKAEKGRTVLRRYPGAAKHLEIPAVEWIAAGGIPAAKATSPTKMKEKESRCILTATNEEAERVAGMLNDRGIPARLLQVNERFNLADLAEIRHFLRRLGEKETPVISEERWQAARKGLEKTYAGSTALPMCLNILDTFQSVNRVLYQSDFMEFLRESRAEDFMVSEGAEIRVSTMHGAKGREFDRVDLILYEGAFDTEEKKRAVYVAITRARHELTIHTNSRFFDAIAPIFTEAVRVPKTDEEPERLTIALTHRDVDLGFFRGREALTLKLISGQALTPDGNRLMGPGGMPVLRFSKAFIARLERLRKRGYVISGGRIRYILAWKGQEEPREIPIVLPEITLRLSDGLK